MLLVPITIIEYIYHSVCAHRTKKVFQIADGGLNTVIFNSGIAGIGVLNTDRGDKDGEQKVSWASFILTLFYKIHY